ncbi:MAG TPA: MerR family transcriptional regulator [Rubrobacter sp.]|nr:MerR family transcriptional regulator [Rubrobacter sp.]
METLAIGEVARRAGISASAIRYYERAGLLPEPGRVGGKRRYGPEVLRRLALVEAAKRAGLTIAEIRALLHGFPDEVGASERWRSLASRKLEEVDGLMARLGQMRALLAEALRCDCASLEECAELLTGR